MDGTNEMMLVTIKIRCSFAEILHLFIRWKLCSIPPQLPNTMKHSGRNCGKSLKLSTWSINKMKWRWLMSGIYSHITWLMVFAAEAAAMTSASSSSSAFITATNSSSGCACTSIATVTSACWYRNWLSDNVDLGYWHWYRSAYWNWIRSSDWVWYIVWNRNLDWNSILDWNGPLNWIWYWSVNANCIGLRYMHRVGSVNLNRVGLWYWYGNAVFYRNGDGMGDWNWNLTGQCDLGDLASTSGTSSETAASSETATTITAASTSS